MQVHNDWLKEVPKLSQKWLIKFPLKIIKAEPCRQTVISSICTNVGAAVCTFWKR